MQNRFHVLLIVFPGILNIYQVHIFYQFLFHQLYSLIKLYTLLITSLYFFTIFSPSIFAFSLLKSSLPIKLFMYLVVSIQKSQAFIYCSALLNFNNLNSKVSTLDLVLKALYLES